MTRKRCPWSENGGELYLKYHDEEWGVPVHDDRKHFEFLVLEINQCGLSWLTILKKRQGFRQAFAGFDPVEVVRFGEKEISSLLENPAIIRNRQKIQAAINNAGKFLNIQQEFGSFDRFIWAFVDNNPVINHWELQSEIPASSSLSDKISLDLKKRGFQFVGTIVIYAHIQAIGLVNDHLVSCFRHAPIERLHKS